MKVLGFDVGARLQDGAGSSLHRAARDTDGRSVVLKVFASTRAAEVEREYLEAVQGEGVTPLLGVAATDQGPSLVLALAEDGSLKDLLGAGPVPVGRALTIAARVARTL